MSNRISVWSFVHVHLTCCVSLQRVEWHPIASQMNSCYMKGGSEEVCQNYVRILTEKSPGHYLICGTNAYNPLCRDFKLAVSCWPPAYVMQCLSHRVRHTAIDIKAWVVCCEHTLAIDYNLTFIIHIKRKFPQPWGTHNTSFMKS